MSFFRIMSSKRFLYVSGVIPAFLVGNDYYAATIIGVDETDSEIRSRGLSGTDSEISGHGFSATATSTVSPTTALATPTVPTHQQFNYNYKTLRFLSITGDEIAPPFEIGQNNDRSQTTVDVYRHLRLHAPPRKSFNIFDKDGVQFWAEKLFCIKKNAKNAHSICPYGSAPNLIDWLEENWQSFLVEDNIVEDSTSPDKNFLDVQVVLKKSNLKELAGNGCPVRKLLDLGFPLNHIFEVVPFIQTTTIDEGITAKQLKQAGVRITYWMRLAGYTVFELLDGGYTLEEIAKSEYDDHQYIVEKFRREEPYLIKAPGGVSNRYTPEQLLSAGFSHSSIARWYADEPKNLKSLGFTNSHILNAGFEEGFAPDEIEDLQDSWRTLQEDGTLKPWQSAIDLRHYGHSWSAILAGGRSLLESLPNRAYGYMGPGY